MLRRLQKRGGGPGPRGGRAGADPADPGSGPGSVASSGGKRTGAHSGMWTRQSGRQETIPPRGGEEGTLTPEPWGLGSWPYGNTHLDQG